MDNQNGKNGVLDLDAFKSTLGAIKLEGKEYPIVPPPAHIFGKLLAVARRFQSFGELMKTEDPEAGFGEVLAMVDDVLGKCVPTLPEGTFSSLPFPMFQELVEHVLAQVFGYDPESALEEGAAPVGEAEQGASTEPEAAATT